MKQILDKLIECLIDIGIEESILPTSTLKTLEVDSTEQADFVICVQNEFGVSLDEYEISEMTLEEMSGVILNKI